MNSLTVALHRFTNEVDARHAEFAVLLGINTTDLLVLNELYKADSQPASVLARSVNLAATSFTPALDRLQKKGLICRKPHPTDRRAVLISLTPQGEAQRRAIVGHMDASEQYLRGVLSDRVKAAKSFSPDSLFAPLPKNHPF